MLSGSSPLLIDQTGTANWELLMYALDINFLQDRADFRSDSPVRKAAAPRADTLGPLALGALVAAIFVGLGLATFIVAQTRIAARQQVLADLQQQQEQIKQQQQEVAQLTQELQQTREQTKALVGVFDQIQPWSALLQDLRSRVPNGVQLRGIAQQPDNTLVLTGQAVQFDPVSDLMLAVQNSPFLDPQKTQLTKVERAQDAARTGNPAISYEIRSALNDKPASQLLPDLQRQGAVGLVERIRTIQEIGALNQ
ncbi:PilN domain-containing protein [Leptolyngbya sp. FACHB-261]|uniref:PilN domain-containing protein n=1 Tax=Leptolyngbya sp. FACHB-261 TaxID=2692806 RepID=UPI001682FEA1|nr:PilN domain-containing protein [Leptolyngbya sp. FACHB-261]MBD2100490.1 PilN domain-containing protein [Leptolyngbya sp. FACHB-261]